METCSWRCLPTTTKGNVARRSPWIRDTNPLHGWHHSCVCLSGISITCKSRGFDDLHARSLRVFGNARWICLIQDLQELWWRKVEEQCPPYLNVVSGNCIWSLLPDEPCALVRRLFRSHTLPHLSGLTRPLVWCFGSIDFCRVFLRISEETYRASCTYKPNPEAGSGSKLLYTADSWCHYGWSSALRMHLHSIVLRS